MNLLPIEGTIVLQGKRFSGKSHLAKDILHNMKDKLGSGMVISGTEGVGTPFFSEFVPDIFISNEFDEKKMLKVLKSLARLARARKKAGISELRTRDRAFIIFDDMMASLKNPANSEALKTIFLNGRHYGIFFLITTQYLTLLPPSMRSNIDCAFLFQSNNEKELKQSYENYACSIFDNYKEFKAVNNALPKNHCIVVMVNSRSGAGAYIYKAPEEIPEFKMCNEEFWDYDREYRKGSDDETCSSDTEDDSDNERKGAITTIPERKCF